jgi:hypothetical protein
VHRREFREAQAAQDTQNGAENPNGENQGKRTGVGGDPTWFDKDPSADGISDDDRYGHRQTEHPRQGSSLGV